MGRTIVGSLKQYGTYYCSIIKATWNALL